MNKHLHRRLCYGLLGMALFQQGSAFGQETASTKSRLERPAPTRQRPLRDVLADLERRHKVFFTYESKVVRGKLVDADLPATNSLDAALQQILRPVGLRSERVADKYYSIVADNSRPTGSLPPRLTDGALSSLREAALPATPERDLSSLNVAVEKPVQTVSGRITDETDSPLVGVSVIERGTQNGTVTNQDGRFTLTVAGPQSVLVFSFVGYTGQQQTVGTRTAINVQLAPDTKALGEVVVVGYGTQRRASVTGAVDQVGQQALEGRPTTTLTQALQGTSPNLIIQQSSADPGAPLNINIRGISTLGNNSPLVVIDGIPSNNTDALSQLNPADIESITVLKDAGSAAIYGSRSANGVLLVTTRKGSQTGRVTVTYNGTYGLQAPAVQRKSVEAWEYMVLKNEALANSGLPAQFTPTQIGQQYNQGSYKWYLDEILRAQSPQQNHNLSISGGNAQTTYLISAGYMDQSSQFQGPGFGFKRYNFRMNLTQQVGKVHLVSLLSYSRNVIKSPAFGTGSLIVDAARMPRTYPVRDSLGRYVLSPILSESNPLARLQEGGYRTNENNSVYGNVSAEYEILNGWKVRGLFGGTLNNYHQYQFQRAISYAPYVGGTDNTNSINDNAVNSLYTNLQLITSYDRQFGKHSINALAGYSNEGFTSSFFQVTKTNVDNTLGTDISGTIIQTSNNATTNSGVNSDGNTSQYALSSVFGRLNYTFADRYIIEGNFRYDGSSRFAKANRWGFFPSVAAAWRLTEESFARGFRDRLGDWKLRASYGILGNQNVSDFQYLSTYTSVPNVYAFNNTPVAGTSFVLANPNLTWERARTFNIGLDAAVWRNKLTFSFDYFDKLTSNILINPSIPGTFGGNQGVVNGAFQNAVPAYNAGQVRNRGWEVSATLRERTGNFNHTLTFNLADSRNEVTALAGQTYISQLGELAVILKQGLPVNSYFGYQTNGYFQNLGQLETGPFPSWVNRTDLRPGDIRYRDQNGDNVIDANDRVVLGNPFPRYTFGARYNVTWNGFDFSVFAQGVGKRSYFLRGEAFQPFHGPYQDAIFLPQTDYWTPINPNAIYPRLTIGATSASNNNWNQGSDFFLQNAAYLRIKNIQFGYTLPNSLTRKIGMSRARIYYTGQNLLTLTRMRVGIDPEVSEFNNSLGYSNGDANSGRVYPNPMYNGVGLDITF